MMDMVQVRSVFRTLIAKRDQADELTLALMRHPDVRTVQDRLMEVCDMKLRIHERLCDAVTKLRKEYPDTRTMLHPWNRAEYNQYQRVTEEIV